MPDTLRRLNALTPDSRAAQLLRAIAAYERERERVEWGKAINMEPVSVTPTRVSIRDTFSTRK